MRAFFAFLMLLLSFACAPRVGQQTLVPQSASLGVAHFSHPTHGWELLAGAAPEGNATVSQKVLQQMDEILDQSLKAKRKNRFAGPVLVDQCQEVVIARKDRTRLSALKYWLAVGRCMPVDYLLVPYVFYWQERSGGEWGAEEPAQVIFDLNLIDMKTGQLQRFHFDEAQASLSSNLLQMGTFFKRGGKWLTVKELTKDGIEQGIQELGL